MTGQGGVGVPEGGELGHVSSCLDVPKQEWVWVHKAASVCSVLAYTCTFASGCLGSWPSLLKHAYQVTSVLSLSFLICCMQGAGNTGGDSLARKSVPFTTLSPL